MRRNPSPSVRGWCWALPLFALSCGGGGGADAPGGAPTSALAITSPSTLAVGALGSAYLSNLASEGGSAPYAWSVVAGALPPGLALGADGVLSGTATGAGAFDFTVEAEDAAHATATRAMTLRVAGADLAGFGTNLSFESGLTGWMQLGSGAGVGYAITADAVDGAQAARVTNRGQLTHAPGQSVFSATLANAEGTPITTRFWIKLDAPGMARCNLRVTADAGLGPTTSSIILAEAVVRTTGAWVEVTGTTSLTWSGALSAAALEFSVGQPAENVFPDFTLDHLSIGRDADSDGVFDSDESGAGVFDADRDHDGLPDGWESAHAVVSLLDADSADAQSDADGDGFTNHQEYWAATDPGDPASRPGVSCVPTASAATQAAVRGLALLPSLATRRVLAGQHITGGPTLGGIPGEYDDNVQALFNQTGHWPALLSLQYEGADATVGPLQISAVNAQAVSWAASGGVVLIKYQPFDPWTMAASSPAGGVHVDLVGLLDPSAGNPANLVANTAANSLYEGWLDQVVDGLEQLGQAGIVVLWRPYSEMNNGAHWHSRQPRDAWIALWRQMYDEFTNVRGLTNLVWVYESDGVAHAVVPADYYYPGADVVDFMGHNFYDDDWTLPYDLDALYRRYPKIYGFPQAGSQSVRDGTWDNRTMILGIQQRSPRASLFCTWNDFYNGPLFVTRSMVSQMFASELLDDPWVVTRDELTW